MEKVSRVAVHGFLATAVAMCLHAGVSAQQAGENVNVLPVLGTDPIRGDAYLQRQLEPSLAVSTRNPEHILAFFNDYRTVDIPGDIGVGESVASRVLGAVRGVLARMLGRPAPRHALPEEAAAAEAWIGMSRSYDGGLTWAGSFLPGFKLDVSAASTASPVFGLDAASDPVVTAAPCGVVYVGFVAFVRGGNSAMAVARFEDLNDSEHGETWVYKGTTIVQTGNNATNGYFLDKPALAVDISRPTSGCAHTVYLTYTTFNGLSKTGQFQSQVHMATSTDGGQTFSNTKINGNFNENQGSAIAIDGRSGDVNVFWRHFFTPDTIVYTQLSASTGRWTKPVAITPDSIQTFDQPSLSTTALADPGSGLTFRSNGFPAAAVARDGTILVAWQERVDAATGLPMAGGTPRIVMTALAPASSVWSARQAIDNATRPQESGGLGFFFNLGRSDQAAHPQVMPSLSCAAGFCLLTYYEARTADLTSGPNPGWIGGYDRVMDMRAALINSNLTVARSLQVSRYPYKVGRTGETPADIDEVAQGVPRMNFVNRPTSGGGTTPFIGDYTALVANIAFVPDGNGGWRWPLNDTDVPYAGFRAAWGDNRNLIPPATGIPGYPNYAPPNGGACGPNVGSRNTDVMTAPISLGLLVTAPLTTKLAPTPPDVLIDFPMTVWNNTNQLRQFTLTIDQNPTFASFSKTSPVPVTSGNVTIYPFSSVTKVVYVANTQPTHVSVTESTPSGSLGLTGSLTFNGGWSNPTPIPSLAQPTLRVSDPANPIPQNPIPQNPIPQNPIPQNPIPQNFGITDTTWTVSAAGDPTKAYLALLHVDKAYANDYAFQLFITKPATTSSCVAGAAVNLTQGTLIANVWDPSNPIPQNPIPQNPIPQNNGFPDSTVAQNSTFIVSATNATPMITAAATVACPDASGNYRLDACTAAAPRAADVINLTLRAYQKTPAPVRLWTPDTLPPSLTVTDYWCDGTTPGATQCTIIQKGPDLVVPPTLTASPSSVVAGAQVTFPAATVSVLNNGNFQAGPRRYGFYLSTSSTLPLLPDGTADLTKAVLLGAIPFATVLAPGASDQIAPQSLTIPAATAGGQYFLFLYADDQRVVSELNENNNIGVAGPITVLTRPDLAVPATVPPPTSPVNAGATLTFPSVTASNIGGTDSGPWRYAYYVSQSATFNPTTAMQLGSSFAGPASFPPGATFVIPAQLLTVPSTLTVDPATGLANYYFFLFVDSDQAVVEITKANNVATMGPVVVSKKANLVVPASLVVQPSTVNAGSTVQFPYGGAQVLNSGNGSAGPRTYGIYYSANATFDATATLLQTIAFSALLPPGGSDSIAQQTLTIPLNIARDPVTGIGTYYLYLVADIYNTVVESNRANNVGRSGPLTVYAPAYGFLGLQSPCNGLSCSGNAGASSPLLWQFTLGGVPVDSPNARPEIWIYLASCTTWAPGPLFSAGTPDDPGSSSWQYPSGSAPFTWQYNWKDPLATPGCYLVYIGSRASGQTVPNGTAFGPVRFTLK